MKFQAIAFVFMSSLTNSVLSESLYKTMLCEDPNGTYNNARTGGACFVLASTQCKDCISTLDGAMRVCTSPSNNLGYTSYNDVCKAAGAKKASFPQDMTKAVARSEPTEVPKAEFARLR